MKSLTEKGIRNKKINIMPISPQYYKDFGEFFQIFKSESHTYLEHP